MMTDGHHRSTRAENSRDLTERERFERGTRMLLWILGVCIVVIVAALVVAFAHGR